jgi:TolA-binding protein
MPVTKSMRGKTGRHCFYILLCVVLWTQCAYFNTYYNAKTAYNAARREHTRLVKIAAGDTAVTLTPQITDLYDRAIAKSLKVLEVYPRSKDWHDDAVYLMARASYYKGEPSQAIRRLHRLQREFPESPFIPESYFFLGKAYLESDNLELAEETFNFILEKYPYLNNKEEVTFLLAEVAIKREGKSQAIELLEKTLKTVHTPEKKMEIRLKMARLLMDFRQWEKAYEVLKDAPRKRGFYELAYQIELAMLECRGQAAAYEDALALANRMLRNRHYIIHYPEIMLRKGRIYTMSGKPGSAMEMFEQITKTAVGPPSVQGEAWYELGILYQHNRGDFAKAQECFDKAAALLVNEKTREDARKHSEAIVRMKSLQAALIGETTADTSDTADSLASNLPSDTASSPSLMRYHLGEVFWLRLEEPDSALRHFSVLTEDTASGDTIRRQALYAKAWISLHMKEDSLFADSIFRHIIKSYPATLYAKRAQAELGDSVTTRTREDSAYQAFVDAEKLYFSDGDAVAASNAYLLVARTYHDLDIAPQSVYAAAWICDEVLNKNVTAQTLYKMLCDSFPKSDLCISEAKPRLRAVDDSLDVLAGKPRKTSENEQPKVDSTAGKTGSPAALPDSMWRYRRGGYPQPGARPDWRRGRPGAGNSSKGDTAVFMGK